MKKNAKIFVAGHGGLVGSAIVRKLRAEGYDNLLLRRSAELDLMDQKVTLDFFKSERPDYVFLAAAKVGGIHANNTYPAEFIYNNLMIAANVIHSAYLTGVVKLLFLGSSCIYPKMAKQPMSESELLGGYLEPTNEPYAIAKISGLKLCEYYSKQYGVKFISAMPTNLYGPGDNYHPENSHVLPALIRRFHEAKISNKKDVIVWGSGSPQREFLYSDDLADALLFLMKNYNETEFVNVGTGTEVTIKELAETVKSVVGFTGNLVWDKTKPDGTPRKLLDCQKIHNLGWMHSVEFEDGIKMAYNDFLKNYNG